MEHNKNDRITIVVLEDNEFTRNLITSIIRNCADFLLLGEAATGEEAISLIDQLCPDIFLADIELPGIDGIEAVKTVRANWPMTRAIMLTAHDNDADLFKSFAAGAEGYLLKSGLKPTRLELAVKSVHEGSVWLDPQIAQRVLTAAAASAHVARAAGAVEPISQEEREVLENVAENRAPCENGVCHVQPAFLERLQRFSKQGRSVAS